MSRAVHGLVNHELKMIFNLTMHLINEFQKKNCLFINAFTSGYYSMYMKQVTSGHHQILYMCIPVKYDIRFMIKLFVVVAFYFAKPPTPSKKPTEGEFIFRKFAEEKQKEFGGGGGRFRKKN